MRQEWDKEVDVVVVGYGAAGGVAAIVAHDAGSKVLLLEKGAYPGGCSILAGGFIRCVHDVEAACQYLAALSGGRVGEDLIRGFAQGLSQNEELLRRLAQADGAQIKVVGRTGDVGTGLYPFPGRESLYSVTVAAIPSFSGFPWVSSQSPNGVNMFKLVMDNMEARGIEVWLSSPARRLETNPEGEVVGVLVERDGREWAVKARQGVVLACGGFEQSERLRLQHLQGKPFYSAAPLTHTGDGIAMAQEVGAALWHMWHVHGSYGFKFPEYPVAFRHSLPGRRNPTRRMPWIVVDRFGARYMNEYPPAPQDISHRPMEFFDPDLPGYPRIPSYLIFDEEGRTSGPVAHPLALGHYAYEWSRDNSREVERGWILRAQSIRELARAIRGLPENGGIMNQDILGATIAQWNGVVRGGKDLLGRPEGTMMAIRVSPFYAAQVWPIITNTQGGPVHNAHQQVMGPFGQPIPRLYAAGELGSFFGHLYELGGNLGECFSSGRIAGQWVSAEVPLP